MLDQSYYDKADEIVASHGAYQESLIPIIQDIQSEYRYLPPELLSYVAEKSASVRPKRTVWQHFMRISHLNQKENMSLRSVMVQHVM